MMIVESSDPGSISEGLCGNNNGDRDDDTIPKGGTTPDTARYEYITFTSSYMLVFTLESRPVFDCRRLYISVLTDLCHFKEVTE